MALDLHERLVPHLGERGASREEVVRDFLRSYLPKRFEVSTGFVFDSSGQVSEQIDIIIADSTVAPRFETTGGIRFYPCEAVVAAGEVKSSVSSRRELWDAFSQLRSVAILDRSAGGRAHCFRTRKPIDQRRNHLHRIFTFLVMTDRVPKAELTRDVLLAAIHRSESYQWPNITVALDRYLVTYHCDEGVCPNTEHARGLSVVQGGDSLDTLLSFYVYLSQAITVTSVAQVSSWAYLGDLFEIAGDVYYAATEAEGEPPPYLSAHDTLPWTYPFEDDNDDSAS